jgi:type VI protein secretion system component Hcp
MSLSRTNSWKWLVALGAVFVPGLVSAALSLPYSFTSGQPIRAAEVNANFEALRARVDAISGTSVPSSIGTLNVTGSLSGVPIRKINFSVTVPPPVGGVAARPVFSDIEVVRDLGAGTPLLFTAANAGTSISSADITIGALKITLGTVAITKLGESGGDAPLPLETIGLSYRTITMTYTPPGGAAKSVNWDRAANTGSNIATNLNYGYFGPGVAPSGQLIPILGYSHLVTRAGGTSGGAGTAKSVNGPIVIERGVSSESLDEVSAAWSGRRVVTTNLSWFAAGTTATEQLQLSDSAILGWTLATRVDGTVSTKVEYSYNRIALTVGTQQATWNPVAGTP